LAFSTTLRVSSRSSSVRTSPSSAVISAKRPRATSMAGTRSFLENGLTRYAMAPASRARSTSSRWLKAVSTMTGAILWPAICSAADSPSRTGIWMSRITRSGRSSAAWSTAC
jgi:hypothetical protein